MYCSCYTSHEMLSLFLCLKPIFLQDIDKYIDNAKQNGYVALLRVGRQGLNVATDTFLKTAVTVNINHHFFQFFLQKCIFCFGKEFPGFIDILLSTVTGKMA